MVGGDINIVARGKDDGSGGKEGGDINVVGSNISGDNVTLKANEDVNILAGQNTTDMTGSNKSSGGSIGVEISLGSGFKGIGISANGGKGTSNGQTVENVESLVTARDTLTIESGKDTNIIGSQVAGNTVVAEIGGDLNIESLQDKDNYHEKNTNWNAGGSISATGVPSFSGGASTQKIDSEYKSVQEQAGIYAGTGGFDITVGGNTDLKGAVIDSKADADKNKLSTGTRSYSDIKNEAEWSAETKGANIGLGGGTAEKDKGITPNFAGSKGEDDSTTKSAIAPGEIEIRSDEGKADKDKTDLADLSRDPDKANNPLDKIFDKDKILEQQQAADLFGEIAYSLAGELATNGKWLPDDPRRIVLHGIIGGIMAEISGGNFGEGLTTGALNELIIGQILKKAAEYELETGKKLLSASELQWISAGIGGAISGSQGAGISVSGTKNNDLGHPVFVKVPLTDDAIRRVADWINLTDEQVEFIKNQMGEVTPGEATDDRILWYAQKFNNAQKIESDYEFQVAVGNMTPDELSRNTTIIGSVVFILAGPEMIAITAGSPAYQSLVNTISGNVAYGTQLGRVGTYVRNPNVSVDWNINLIHGAEMLEARGVTPQMVNNWVANGKAIQQAPDKWLFITPDGCAVVNSELPPKK